MAEKRQKLDDPLAGEELLRSMPTKVTRVSPPALRTLKTSVLITALEGRTVLESEVDFVVFSTKDINKKDAALELGRRKAVEAIPAIVGAAVNKWITDDCACEAAKAMGEKAVAPLEELIKRRTEFQKYALPARELDIAKKMLGEIKAAIGEKRPEASRKQKSRH
jgi:hypothetical protein